LSYPTHKHKRNNTHSDSTDLCQGRSQGKLVKLTLSPSGKNYIKNSYIRLLIWISTDIE